MAKIIVGVEDSFRSEDAVALAGELARASGAEVVAVSAFPFDDRPASHFNYELREPLREIAEATLERLCEPLSDVRVQRIAVADLSPGRALLGAAISSGADLIVVGSSRAGFGGGVRAGSTAWRLFHGAHCAVAIAPQGQRLRAPLAAQPVAAGFDGSPGALDALDAAAVIARGSDRPLRVIRAFTRDWPAPPALPGFLRCTEDAEAAAREELASAVDGVPGAQAAFLVGDPVAELARESEYCALLVLGSRGYGRSGAVLLGDVTGRLIYTALCPLLIVPHDVRPALGQLFADAAVGIA